MTYLLIGFILGLIIGVLLGGFTIKQFNVSDSVINGKIKAKKGSNIDYKLNIDKNGNNKRTLGRITTRFNGVFKNRSKLNTKRKG